MEVLKLEFRPATEAESRFAYTRTPEGGEDAGCIGHLRGDFGSSGISFYSSWFDAHKEKNTLDFKKEFDSVIDNLRFNDAYSGVLRGREAARKCGWANPDSMIEGSYATEFAFRINTTARSYLLRINPNQGDYNFYVYAYDKKLLEPRLRQEEGRLRKKLRERPVYYPDYEYANKHDEVKLYHASSKANQACKQAIEKAIAAYYDGQHLGAEAASQVLDAYGFERTMCVLANTVRRHDHDGRYSRANKNWAATVTQPPDRVMEACCVSSHPCLVDLFVDEVRHRHLLTLPLTDADIKAEAERILSGFRNAKDPNSPDGTHFLVKLSDDFTARAKSRQLIRLGKYFPFPSIAISAVMEDRSRYASINADEDRTKPLRKLKPRKKEQAL
ncbi:MAG: DUF3849 domain-containing protein [Oscillospiraceae bacterium]|nr:DUF3849 domain-containing protein [Oscillospiraceae bacterium]